VHIATVIDGRHQLLEHPQSIVPAWHRHRYLGLVHDLVDSVRRKTLSAEPVQSTLHCLLEGLVVELAFQILLLYPKRKGQQLARSEPVLVSEGVSQTTFDELLVERCLIGLEE